MAQRGQPVHQQSGDGQEVHQGVGVTGGGEVRGPLGEDLQGPRLIAGQRAELDVQRHGVPHGLHRADHPVPAQVVTAGLLGAAGAQQRKQRGRQHGMGLMGAGVLPVEDRPPGVKRLLVLPAVHLPGALAVQFAGVAVGHPVPVGRLPGGVRPLGPLQIAEMAGDLQLALAHGPFGMPGEPVAVCHLALPLLDGGERYVRLIDHGTGDPLEHPEEVVGHDLVEASGLLVPHAQQAREGDEHLVLLRAVVVRLQLVGERLDEERRVPGPFGLGQQPLRTGVAGRPLRLLVVVPQGLPDRRDVEAHRPSSCGRSGL